MIYKLITKSQWQVFQRTGVFSGSAVDIADGYIHFSTAKQLAETAAKHFSGQCDLVLLEVDNVQLGPGLKFEPARDGELFPHLYDKLPLSRVCHYWSLEMDESGQHVLPQALRTL